jgi:hypothetical protein
MSALEPQIVDQVTADLETVGGLLTEVNGLFPGK